CYYDMLQGFGMLSAGLQQGRLQSIAPDAGGEPAIRVFPAWDIAKPASFRLLAKGGFLVSAAAKSGAVSYVEIVSRLGGTCRVRNPWPEASIDFYRNGVKANDCTVTAQTLVTFKTQKGETLTLIKRGTNPETLRETIGQ
ncbi:MAG: glycoside hydrolase family 95-like protein, partial [bacterium]